MANAETSNDTLLEQTEIELFRSGLRLRFAPSLEGRYQNERNTARNRQSAIAAFVALVIYELLVAGLILRGGIKPDMVGSYVLLTHLAVSLPTFLFSILGFCNVLRQASRELFICAVYLSLCSIPSLYGFYLVPEYALGTQFTDVLVIVACNIAMPLSFRYAAPAASLGTVILSASVLYNLQQNTSLGASIVETYVAAALLTMVANYRSEWADRRNFLHMLRESVHNSMMAEKNQQLERLSLTDSLTGLANRRKFDDAMIEAVQRAEQFEQPVSLLMFDLDHFKAYNDHYGHPAGDVCLKTIAQRLSACAGKGTLARLGGEEFALLLPEIGETDAMNVAELLRKEVHALAIPHHGLGPDSVVTLSIGVVTANTRESRNAEWLLRYADDALYEGKRGGRNTVTAYKVAA